MFVKATYTKVVKVTGKISKEEIDSIPISGMPRSFDIMADEIDNKTPLKFYKWEIVKDDYYHKKKNLNMFYLCLFISAIAIIEALLIFLITT